MKTIAGWLTALVVILWTPQVIAKDPPLLSLSMEHFRDTATLKDDALDTTATITTEPGFVEHHGLLRVVSDDGFLRGFIDKKTGAKTLQVYEFITYYGDWRSYNTANYQTPDGPKSVPAIPIAKEVVDCSGGVSKCTVVEHVAFIVDESLLRQIAAGYVPGKPAVWLYKLIAQAGPDFEDGFSNAEVAGFLAKVDAYTAAHPIANSTSAKPELGVNFVPLPPSADQPARSGLLIVQVKSGSVAERARVQVGDIMTEFSGTPLKQLADLQAALATVSAGASVPLKVIRGATDLQLTAQF
jgi:hypothetical protein